MFTGIIEKKAKILSRNGGKFRVENTLWEDLTIGQSIAHDWACMTIESFDRDAYTFFVMEESLKKINFSMKKTWDMFNIERCVRVGERLDGHFVSGHIDTVWLIQKIARNDDGSHLIGVSFDKKYSELCIEKGSICINGISLTIVSCGEGNLTVSIIPHTWSETNLWTILEWEHVNLEFDMLWKYIRNFKK